MKKIVFLIIIFLFISLTLVSASGVAEEQKEINVAFSFGAEWLELYQAMEDMLLKAAEESGGDIKFQFWYADGDEEKESLNIDKAIASRPDVLVLMPLNSQRILTHIEHANARKIPVIVYNRQQASHESIRPAAFIGLDTYNQGYTTAVGLFKLMKQDGISARPVILLGDLRDRNSINRRAGFHKASEDFNIEIIDEIQTDWNAKKAADGLEKVFEEYPDVNALLISSDFMITEIKRVLSQNGRWEPYGESGHIYIGAQDAFKEAIPLIREGYIDVDTAFDVWPMSTTLIQVINTLAAGQVPAQDVFLVPGRVITGNNIDQTDALWSVEPEVR